MSNNFDDRNLKKIFQLIEITKSKFVKLSTFLQANCQQSMLIHPGKIYTNKMAIVISVGIIM